MHRKKLSRPRAFAVFEIAMTSSTTFHGLMDRQIGRLLAFEDATIIDAELAILVGNACPVAHQRAPASTKLRA
jgi:hypothetical protein